MKLFVNHLDKASLEKKLEPIKNVDFSLFVEDIPKLPEDLSPINIIVLFEPNEYFGRHDWVIANSEMFSVIMTWDDKIINNCPNAIYHPFGHSWFKSDQYQKQHKKKFQISHLCGKLLKTYGQSLRHELLARKNEIKVPTKYFDVYGDRYNIEEARKGKEEVFGDSMFGVAIENASHNGYFTEKILDCFLLKTIPMYWGCTNIDSFFNKEGIIKFGNVDEFTYISNTLNEDYYNSRKEIIEENYQKALQYVDYESNVVNKITEIFELNKLI